VPARTGLSHALSAAICVVHSKRLYDEHGRGIGKDFILTASARLSLLFIKSSISEIPACGRLIDSVYQEEIHVTRCTRRLQGLITTINTHIHAT
jgi:hypothetical protein